MYKNKKIDQFYSQVLSHFQVMYRYYPIPLQKLISKITPFLPNPFYAEILAQLFIAKRGTVWDSESHLLLSSNRPGMVSVSGRHWTITLYIILTDRYMISVSSSLVIQWLQYRIIQRLQKDLHLQWPSICNSYWRMIRDTNNAKLVLIYIQTI